MSNSDDNVLGPMQRAQRQMRPELPRRFYTNAKVAAEAGGHAVRLDGKPVRTPGKRLLLLPTPALAEAIAAEWQAQGDRIDPATMPLTRLANTVLDAVIERMDEVRADALKFGGSDLLCYRATHPAELVERQSRHWAPILGWAAMSLGARLDVIEGITHRTQPEDALAAIGRALEALDAFALAGVHELTTLSGSVVIGLAIAKAAITIEGGWTAAHVDEDWQIGQWGEDFEAAERRKRRRADFEAAARLISLSRA
jgi:chaperone required for assembly of F1-ATPase